MTTVSEQLYDLDPYQADTYQAGLVDIAKYSNHVVQHAVRTHARSQQLPNATKSYDNEELNPFLLTREQMPEELQGWLRQCTDHFFSSSQDSSSLKEQKAYFCICIEQQL